MMKLSGALGARHNNHHLHDALGWATLLTSRWYKVMLEQLTQVYFIGLA